MIYKINKDLLLEAVDEIDSLKNYEYDAENREALGDDFDLESSIENYEQNRDNPIIVNQRQDDEIFNNSLELRNQSFDIADARTRANIGLGLGITGLGLGTAALGHSLGLTKRRRIG